MTHGNKAEQCSEQPGTSTVPPTEACKHKRAKLVHAWGAFSTSMAPKLVTDAVTAPTDLLTLHGCSENAFAASDSLLSYTPHHKYKSKFLYGPKTKSLKRPFTAA